MDVMSASASVLIGITLTTVSSAGVVPQHRPPRPGLVGHASRVVAPWVGVADLSAGETIAGQSPRSLKDARPVAREIEPDPKRRSAARPGIKVPDPKAARAPAPKAAKPPKMATPGAPKAEAPAEVPPAPMAEAPEPAALKQAEPPPPVARIEFRIKTKKGKGKVRCGLYSQAKDWLSRRYAFKDTAMVQGRTATCVFEGVPKGTYAASAYHDANNNSKFDKNFLGLPAEDFTFSAGAKAGLGPPKFEDADFVFPGGTLVVTGKM